MILKRVIGLEKLATLIPVLAKENSQNAWKEFVQITGNDLHRYICYFIHDTEHASDILQEVYILFLRDIKIFVKVSSQENEEIAAKKIYAWLYKTARNKSFDLIKKKKNGLTAKTLLTQQATTREHTMPVNNLEKKETNEIIKYELSFLNEKQQNLLTLKFFHEKSNLEIAREINCEVISVPKLIDRALAQLKKRLEKVGITLSLTLISESLVNKAMCADIPTNLLPEVFQLYQTAPMGGLLTKPITFKGILMKSLYTIVGATALCTIFFYLNLPTQEQKKIENTKKISIAKENSQLDKDESTKNSEIIKIETNADTNNSQKEVVSVPTKLTYQLENHLINFKINSIQQLIDDYKKSPYFQFANSSATGQDFDRIDFSKIYDLYNDSILNLLISAKEFKKLFETMKEAKSFEFQSDLNRKFNLIFEFTSEEEAQLKKEDIDKWLKKSIEEKKKYYLELEEENKKEIESLNPGTVFTVKANDGLESYKKTITKRIGNTLYVFNDAKEIKLQEYPKNSGNNVSLLLTWNKTILKNPVINTIAEALNIDSTSLIQINYEFNKAGLSEIIEFETKNDKKLFFDKVEISEFIKEFLKDQKSNGQLVTHIKPFYFYSLIKMVGSNIEENFEQKLLMANLLCFQKLKKSIEMVLKDSLTGEIIAKTDPSSFQILLGLTKENKIKEILENLSKDFELPFQWQIINNNYLKITTDALFSANSHNLKKLEDSIETELLFFASLDSKSVFQNSVNDRLLLAQKYADFDVDVKKCIPLLTNNQIYDLFQNSDIKIMKTDRKVKLIINSAIPYLFGYLFFENMEIGSQEPESTIIKDNITVQGESEITEMAADKTLFSKRKTFDSNTTELIYFDESGNIEWSYKKNEDANNYKIEKFNKNSKLLESYGYRDNSIDGEYKQFDKNGSLIKSGQYTKGVKSGKWEYFNGDEKTGEINYINGNPKSFEKKFPGGAIETKVEVDELGKGTGKIYYKNGQIQLEGEYINFKKVNTWKSYNPNGGKKTEIQYNLFGEKQKFTSYYENQAKHFDVPFKNNLIDGKVQELYQDGKVKGEFQIKNGVPSPIWVLFGQDGKISGEWLNDNSYTGIFKENNENSLKIKYTLLYNNFSGKETILNPSILNIEAKLNLMYSRGGEYIVSTINGPSAISIANLEKNENFRGISITSIVIPYGMFSSKDEIKESILYQINSWNMQLNEFIEDSTQDCFFLMNDHIIYKLYIQNGIVKTTEYFEYANELF